MKQPLLCVFMIFCASLVSHAQTTQPNIILITMDDCNDYIEGLDGHPQISTPNIKYLMRKGALFYNAYANSPKCAPSRVSFYTGKQPNYTNVYHNFDINCNLTLEQSMAFNGVETYYTIPMVLKDSSGYFTYSISKNMHCHNNLHGYDMDTEDECAKGASWNKVTVFDGAAEQIDVLNYASTIDEGLPEYHFAAIPDSLETKLQDYLSTDSAISFIEQVAADSSAFCNKPFFMAIGYRRPHGPFYIPEKYFLPAYDVQYDNPGYKINFDSLPFEPPTTGLFMPPQPDVKYADYFALPENGVARALIEVDAVYSGIGIKINSKIADGIFPQFQPGLSEAQREALFYDSYSANMIMAYMASIQFIDAQIGRLLASLAENPDILNNTIIIIFGDHGFSLGEKNHWKKGALWETDIRTPLLVVDFRNPVKRKSNATVGLIDLFQTILELTDTPEPLFPDGSSYLDGVSLVPLIDGTTGSWEKPILSSYRNMKSSAVEGSCFPSHSIRTKKWHYIRYRTNGDSTLTTCNKDLSEIQEELYNIGVNREIDPYEWNNLAYDPAYSGLIEQLASYLPGNPNYNQFARTSFDVVPESDENVALLIAPNPTSDITSVLVPGQKGDWELIVTSITGVVVYRDRGYNDFNIMQEFLLEPSAEAWSPGTYLVKYQQAETTRTGKLIVH